MKDKPVYRIYFKNGATLSISQEVFTKLTEGGSHTQSTILVVKDENEDSMAVNILEVSYIIVDPLAKQVITGVSDVVVSKTPKELKEQKAIAEDKAINEMYGITEKASS